MPLLLTALRRPSTIAPLALAAAMTAALASPALATPFHAGRAAALSVSGVTAKVTNTKVSVDFSVSNKGKSKSATRSASLALVGGGHTYGLGSTSVPSVAPGKSVPVSVTNTPAPQITAGTYAVRVCLPPISKGICATGASNVVIGNAALTASPSTLAAPATAVGATSAPVSTTLTNTGQSTTGLISLALTGPDATSFKVGPTGCHKSLGAGQSCTPAVTFTPTKSGTSTASLVATGATGGTVTVTLTGTTPSPGLSASPTTFAFPDTATGQTATTKITITNNGSTASGAITAAFSGSGASAYSADTSACPAAGLAVGATCTVTVTFKPTATGSQPATLTLSGGSVSSATVTLTGSTPGGTSTGTGLTISPASHDYGNVPVGNKVGFAFTVKNNGTAATGAQTLALSGPQSGSFSVDTGTCTAGLAAGASCTATVSFNPAALGFDQAVLTVTPTTGSAATAQVTGTGSNSVVFSPTSYSYGSHTVGSTTLSTFSLVNLTGTDQPLTSGDLSSYTDFAFDYTGPSSCLSFVVPANGSCTLSIAFKPASTGPHSVSADFVGPNFDAVATLTGSGS